MIEQRIHLPTMYLSPRRCLSFLGKIAALTLICARSCLACTLSLTYADHPSAPFMIGGELNVPAKPGIAIDIAKAAAEEVGCTVKLTRLPGPRVLREVEAGDYDGAIMFSYEPERAQQMVYPLKGNVLDSGSRLATLRYFLYRRKGSAIDWDGTTIRNPGGLPIGINYGYSIGEWLQQKGVKVEEVKTTEQNIGKLQLGRIAGYAMQEHIADAAIKAMHAEPDIEKLSVPLSTKDYFLTFSQKFYREHPDIAKAIWQIIAEKRDVMTRDLLPQYSTK
jgi:polar amino acid transport system substrate-binding protein